MKMLKNENTVLYEQKLYNLGFEDSIWNTNTMEENRQAMIDWEKDLGLEVGTIGMNGWQLFPAAAERSIKGSSFHNGALATSERDDRAGIAQNA